MLETEGGGSGELDFASQKVGKDSVFITHDAGDESINPGPAEHVAAESLGVKSDILLPRGQPVSAQLDVLSRPIGVIQKRIPGRGG